MFSIHIQVFVFIFGSQVWVFMFGHSGSLFRFGHSGSLFRFGYPGVGIQVWGYSHLGIHVQFSHSGMCSCIQVQ